MTTSELSRRSVLTGAAVAVVGGVAGYAVARNSSAAKQKRGTTAANAYGPAPAASGASGGQPLASVAQIPAGGGVILSKQSIVLTRSVDGSVHAFSAVCTHQGCTVDKVSGGAIRCPCHGSTFDAATGAVTGGPAPRPLPSVPVTVRDGGVYRT